MVLCIRQVRLTPLDRRIKPESIAIRNLFVVFKNLFIIDDLPLHRRFINFLIVGSSSPGLVKTLAVHRQNTVYAGTVLPVHTAFAKIAEVQIHQNFASCTASHPAKTYYACQNGCKPVPLLAGIPSHCHCRTLYLP
ncbi:hypothetical protein NPIL_294821 [Nephila pilipes]|uniref:Uncharacterized protein n=1 Tax=Nephila pilipes TaxID=299642 RepID=A0A8X6NRY7_NEPPI|nr:hypothetical protein NPIL_294821 [Nephila pilipes]